MSIIKNEDDFAGFALWSMLTFQEQEEYRDIQSEPSEDGQARLTHLEDVANQRITFIREMQTMRDGYSAALGEAREKYK